MNYAMNQFFIERFVQKKRIISEATAVRFSTDSTRPNITVPPPPYQCVCPPRLPLLDPPLYTFDIISTIVCELAYRVQTRPLLFPSVAYQYFRY